MTTKQKQTAFKEAEKELLKDQVNEVKEIMKSLLQSIWDEKKKKAEAEENLRLLKLDMEDLRAGKLDKIKERHEKSMKSRNISPIKDYQMDKLEQFSASASASASGSISCNNMWTDATAGTYFVSGANGEAKELNL